jgi:hypothetical protein
MWSIQQDVSYINYIRETVTLKSILLQDLSTYIKNDHDDADGGGYNNSGGRGGCGDCDNKRD